MRKTYNNLENGVSYASSAQSSPAPETESWLFLELSDAGKKKIKASNGVGQAHLQEIQLSLFSCVPILPPFPYRRQQGKSSHFN